MFGFGKSKFKAEAAKLIVGCVVRARLSGATLVMDRPDLEEVMQRMPLFKPASWIGLLTVAHLGHNLMCLLLHYRAVNPAGVQKEYYPVVDFVEQMVANHPELGTRATWLLDQLTCCFVAPHNRGLFPRHGWGSWVINNLKRELNGQPTDPEASLNSDEQLLAGAIDDYITGPFIAQYREFYEARPNTAT